MSAMRASLRANPTKALNFKVLVDDLTDSMVASYRLGYSKRGLPFSKATRIAVTNRYKKEARKALTQIQTSSNSALKQAYWKAIRDGGTERQATNAVLRRFNTLGATAPASNRFEALYRSASDAGYMQGIWESQRLDPGVWGFRYLNKEPPDDRIRASHRQFNGVTLPKEHPFWSIYWPPIAWGCRCKIKTYARKQKLVYPPPLGERLKVEDRFIGTGFSILEGDE